MIFLLQKQFFEKIITEGGRELIVLNPFLDSLCNSAFKNIGLAPGIQKTCFQHPQDVVFIYFGQNMSCRLSQKLISFTKVWLPWSDILRNIRFDLLFSPVTGARNDRDITPLCEVEQKARFWERPDQSLFAFFFASWDCVCPSITKILEP